MSHRPIIDAGPGLNFFSSTRNASSSAHSDHCAHKRRCANEIIRKSRQDSRFAAANTVWAKLPERLMQVLSDDATPELATVVHRISKLPMRERLKNPKDLGRQW